MNDWAKRGEYFEKKMGFIIAKKCICLIYSFNFVDFTRDKKGKKDLFCFYMNFKNTKMSRGRGG